NRDSIAAANIGILPPAPAATAENAGENSSLAWTLLYNAAEFCLTESMKRSEAAKYARWSAAVALGLAGVTAAVYLGRGWQRAVAKKNAPPPAPAYVDRHLSGISFSKVEGTQTIYTVEASHSTNFKGDAASLLEDVKITVFGREQNRIDILHTQPCRYTKNPENIDCSGL